MKTKRTIGNAGRTSVPRSACELTGVELEQVEGGVKDVLCTHELGTLGGRSIPIPWNLSPPHTPYPTHEPSVGL